MKKLIILIMAVIMMFTACSSNEPENITEGNDVISESKSVEVVEEKDDVSMEYKNALISAQNYSDLMYMSKAGIFNQLISEYGDQFPEDAAQYAIDNLNVDWKENALKNAENYNETMHMSKKGLYDQLVSEYGEQFTAEEAQYAIDNITVDWKENALLTAKNYQETMAMSKAAIYDQLVSEYGEQFTAEEAQYAVDNLE